MSDTIGNTTNNPYPEPPSAGADSLGFSPKPKSIETEKRPNTQASRGGSKKHRTVLALFLLVAIAIGISVSMCSGEQRSPFSGLLPSSTPLIIEGSPRDVEHFLNQMDISIPDLGDNQGLSGLACSRLLYAAIAPESNGDFTGCKMAITKTVNSLEEQWSTSQIYPQALGDLTPHCPYGGIINYESTGSGYTLSCSGSDHQTKYDSLLGLTTSAITQQPLVIIAFQSDDPRWNEATASSKHPDIKILTSDPERAIQLLDQVQDPLDIYYPKDASLYVSVMNANLSTFWTKLPVVMPGKYTTITKNINTGIYSLRTHVDETAQEKQPSEPTYPVINDCLEALPEGQTRLAASCELLRSLNLLPWSLLQQKESAPKLVGMATNAQMRLSQLLPTFSSGFAGLIQATFSAEFSDSDTATKGYTNSPWGDLSQKGNPDCAGTCQGRLVTANVGEPLPKATTQPELPKGPGPVQMGGVLTITISPEVIHPYAFSGGVHNNQLWMEVKPLY